MVKISIIQSTTPKKYLIGETKACVLTKKAQLVHLINHFEKHALGGDQQLRLYADIMLLNKESEINIPDHSYI